LLAVADCRAKEVYAVAWSPDGRTIATGEVYGARAVRLWDVSALRSSWQPLFDSKSLAGWMVPPESKDSASVTTLDGEPAIRFTGPKKSVDVASNSSYRDFEARIEIRMDSAVSRSGGYLGIGALGGNAGLLFRFSSATSGKFYSDRWNLELEQGEPKKNSITSTGAALPRILDFPTAVVKPAGEWNRFEILRQGDAIAIRLNDRFVDAFAHVHPRLKGGSEPDFGRSNVVLGRTEGSVLYRRIEVREVHELPPGFASNP
ncbi:MAG TPA: family 16 glycoside hydrolase, partial [Gemmataceae bacterium]|nr:family 16 glycoside hydrolase [Gemmataceae bacterium]